MYRYSMFNSKKVFLKIFSRNLFKISHIPWEIIIISFTNKTKNIDLGFVYVLNDHNVYYQWPGSSIFLRFP